MKDISTQGTIFRSHVSVVFQFNAIWPILPPQNWNDVDDGTVSVHNVNTNPDGSLAEV